MATNTNIARGFVPYARFDGSMYNGSANIYYVPSSFGTSIFIGDPVVLHQASNDANGVPAVNVASTGGLVVGAMVGIVNGGELASVPLTVTRDLNIYHPASTAGYILVADDPNLLFWVQDDASTQNTFIPQNFSGLNANFTSGSGSTTTGFSGYLLQASSVSVTGTLDVKIIRALNQADNNIGTATNSTMNAKWLVRLNHHQYVNQTAGS